MPLPDLADLLDLLDLLPAGADQTRAQAKLTQASRRFRGEVRHPVSLVIDDVVTLDGDGSRVLLLPAAPVVDVTSVKIDGEDVTDHVQWSQAGVLRHPRRWPARLRAVKVTYTHGHDPVPDEIQEAVLAMAIYLSTVTPGVSSMQVGGQTVSTSAANMEATVTVPWDTVVDAYRLNRGDVA